MGDLINAHIRLSNDVDELIWDNVDSGGYSPKLGYVCLNSVHLDREPHW